MNKLFYQPVNLRKVILATVLIFLGLFGLLYGPTYLGIFSVALTSYLAFILVFGVPLTNHLFSKPIRPIKISLIYFPLNWVVSLVAGFILTYLLGWQLQGNLVTDHPSLLLIFTLPIMLLGEELFSLFFLSIFSSRFSLTVSSILSAIIFGLIHFSTYYNGNGFETLVHICLIQGSARLIFNQAAIKSNSLWTSWAVHVLFDFSSIVISILPQLFN